MTWLFLLLAMSVIAVVAAVVTGRIGGGMQAPTSSLPFRGLPPDGVTAGDLETVRFSPALRGYRMDEVDQVLDRLGVELQRRDAEIARLGGQLAGPQQPGQSSGHSGEPYGQPGEPYGDSREPYGQPGQHFGQPQPQPYGEELAGAAGAGYQDAYEAAYGAAYGPGYGTASGPDQPSAPTGQPPASTGEFGVDHGRQTPGPA